MLSDRQSDDERPFQITKTNGEPFTPREPVLVDALERELAKPEVYALIRQQVSERIKRLVLFGEW